MNDLRETWATASRDGRFSSDLQRLTQGNPFLQRLLTSDTPAEIGATLRNAPKPFMNTIMQVSGNVFALLGYSFIVLLLMLYTLSRPEPLLQGLIGAVPNGHRGRATRATEDIVAALRVWGLSTLAVMASGGVLVWIGLVALGVDNALVFAFLSALGELIPNVGPLVANSIPVLITFAAEPQRAVWVALWLVGVQIVQGVFSPYLFGKTIELHPVSIIAGIVLLGTAFGLVGAFLTVPILIIVKVLYETYYLSRPDHDEVPEEKVAGILEEA